ncbi:hypothetical protein [Jiangella asiatica]|uniref:Uncharacterized protein n=1 Tax=Jiangella asiatica TaxID=2530372 RepID=A0A4R5DLT9_9ACTN|nr:hypothetical protein [Jiangella asiatica]TDE13024.1 hypothetical protein E1269_06425 [Jiangella asiatica]
MIVQGTVAALLARAGWTRARDRIAGRDAHDRRREAYQENAEFLAGLGHEPSAVLGPRPVRDPSAEVLEPAVVWPEPAVRRGPSTGTVGVVG